MTHINDQNDEIEIIHKSEGKEEVKIFGKKFVENNKEKCKIKYNNKKYELGEYMNVEGCENKIKIKLIIKKFNKTHFFSF